MSVVASTPAGNAPPLSAIVGEPADAVRLSPTSLSLKTKLPAIAAISCAEEFPADSATVVDTEALFTEVSTVWSLVPVIVIIMCCVPLSAKPSLTLTV
ncbi:hypothetical protein G6P99_47750 [Bradyrhizobium sp. 6(2017)]